MRTVPELFSRSHGSCNVIPVLTISAEPYVDLTGDVDFEACVRNFPEAYTLKGLFFARLVDSLADDWPRLHRTLRSPPAEGRYIALADYPQADYAALAGHVARRQFPYVCLREGLRRVARQDFNAFTRTAVGQAFLAVLGDATSTFMTYPVIYPLVMNGASTRSTLIQDGVRMEINGYVGEVSYPLGTYEGFVYAFGHTPRVTVEVHSSEYSVFDVRWGRTQR
jgi:uncharacterized protein (TIGR02265 family)